MGRASVSSLLVLLFLAFAHTPVMAQGISVTNVPLGGIDSGTGAPTEEAPLSLSEIELNYMIAVGGQSYMKQACGDSSWRQDLEKAKTKIQPDNRVTALKGFRTGWNDTRKRFGTDIKSCAKVTGGKGQATSNAQDNKNNTNLDDLLSGMKAPDMSNAAKSAIGTSDLKLQPTVPKPE